MSQKCPSCGLGCPELGIQHTHACCASLLHSELEMFMARYFSCATDNMICWSEGISTAEELMQVDKEEMYVNNINDYMYLYMYLSIIYWQRKCDAKKNPPCYTDFGPKYYYDLYQLECIVNYFRCKNIDIKSMLASFDLYPFGVYTDGIGRMIIDTDIAPPDTCTTNDAIFIVR